MIVIKDLLDVELISDIYNLYENSTNSVIIDGKKRDRYSLPPWGVFLLSKFTYDECKFVWDNIKDKLEGYKPEVFKMLKYKRNHYLPKHIDVSKSGDNPTNASLIIQLSNPDYYSGGEAIVGNQIVELKQGDGVIYSYGEEHEVKKVTKGTRFVMNIRVYKDGNI